MRLINFVLIAIGCFVITEAIPNSRVVNGTDANIEDFPFMVSLRTSSGDHNCGASLISPEWAVSAAHCVESFMYNRYSIQHSLTKISVNGSNVVPVNYSIIHEQYDTHFIINDISLLRLEYPVHVKQYARLPAQFEGTLGDIPATLIGWGSNFSFGYPMETLQRVEIQTFSHEECYRRHNGDIYTSNICGGVPEGWKGQCSGDSGGPLLVNGVLVGLVSWSEKPCTIPPYPGVYTRVSYFREWIRQKTGI